MIDCRPPTLNSIPSALSSPFAFSSSFFLSFSYSTFKTFHLPLFTLALAFFGFAFSRSLPRSPTIHRFLSVFHSICVPFGRKLPWTATPLCAPNQSRFFVRLVCRCAHLHAEQTLLLFCFDLMHTATRNGHSIPNVPTYRRPFFSSLLVQGLMRRLTHPRTSANRKKLLSLMNIRTKQSIFSLHTFDSFSSCFRYLSE